jgi:hypothetical protein
LDGALAGGGAEDDLQFVAGVRFVSRFGGRCRRGVGDCGLVADQAPAAERAGGDRHEADPDEALQRGDRDDPDFPGDQAERQQVDRLDRQALGGADAGKNFSTPKPKKIAPTVIRNALMA